jgi:hypothetical protein
MRRVDPFLGHFKQETEMKIRVLAAALALMAAAPVVA